MKHIKLFEQDDWEDLDIDEFFGKTKELPEKWYIKVTAENKHILNSVEWSEYWGKNYDFTVGGYYSTTNASWDKLPGEEITTEDFIEYFLK